MSRESGVLTVYNPKTTVFVVGVFVTLIIVIIFFVASAYMSNPKDPTLGVVNLPPLSKYEHIDIPTPEEQKVTPSPNITAFPTLSKEHLTELMTELNKLDAPQEVLDELQKANELYQE